MSRSNMLYLFLSSCLLISASAQTLDRKQDSGFQTTAAVQVVYVVDGAVLTTYNVDPQTINASIVGTLTLPESNFSTLTASPNDYFVYYTSYDPSALTKHLWVYATDATGSPKGQPLQELNADKFYGPPAFAPSMKFLYQVTATSIGRGEFENYTIRRYVVNSTTGRITDSQAAARYKLPSGDGGSESCGVFVIGFSSAGSKMYDEISCSYHGGASATFNERTVNVKTGSLGPDVEVYSWDNSSSGGENVQFVDNLVIDLVVPNDYQPGIDSVNVYRAQPNASAMPLIECTASMLEACGYLTGLNLVHPSGKYLFLGISSGTTQIEKVEISSHKIVDTSNYIPYTVERFSPDGSIAYGVESANTGSNLEIYGFNVATSDVTPGGVIYLPSNLDPWFTAQRH
jgi:hypothetical protein